MQLVSPFQNCALYFTKENTKHTTYFIFLCPPPEMGSGKVHVHELETDGTTLAQWYSWHPVLVMQEISVINDIYSKCALAYSEPHNPIDSHHQLSATIMYGATMYLQTLWYVKHVMSLNTHCHKILKSYVYFCHSQQTVDKTLFLYSTTPAY